MLNPLCVLRNVRLFKPARFGIKRWRVYSLVSLFIVFAALEKEKALVSLKAHYILQNLFISEALIAFHISEKKTVKWL